jgi:hypothetical protein
MWVVWKIKIEFLEILHAEMFPNFVDVLIYLKTSSKLTFLKNIQEWYILDFEMQSSIRKGSTPL